MSKLKPYNSYKDSNIEWIGEVPSSWKISKVKYQSILNPSTLRETANENYEIQYIDIGNVDSNGNIINIEHYKFGDAPSRARRIVKDGDTIVSTVRTYLRAITSIKYAPENLVCSTGFAVLRPKPEMNPIYLSYLIRSTKYVDEIVRRSTGVSYPAISSNEIGNLECLLPDLQTQNLIGNFLDKETSEIDSLIADKEKLIELLEEKRQAIITEAVTKGLNPDVKMKDSGVKWTYKIPEQWEITKLKYVSILLNGDRGENYPSGNDFLDEGFPFITSHNLNKRYIDYNNCKYISEERYQLLRGIKIKNSDIIYCLRGSVGKNAMATRDGGTVASSLMGIRCKTNINSRFLLYVLNSKVELWNRNFLTTGSVSDNLSAENVGSYLIPFPSIQEQSEIVAYLNNVLDLQEKLIDSIDTQIEKLKEYRQALIYEAVTGKIDVRDYEKEMS